MFSAHFSSSEMCYAIALFIYRDKDTGPCDVIWQSDDWLKDSGPFQAIVSMVWIFRYISSQRHKILLNNLTFPPTRIIPLTGNQALWWCFCRMQYNCRRRPLSVFFCVVCELSIWQNTCRKKGYSH